MEWRRRILATAAFFALLSVACSGFERVTTPSFGTILVTVVSTGGELDVDGYYLTVDAQQTIQLPVNQTLASFSVVAGGHAVTLQDIARNCVVQGPNPRTISVVTDAIIEVRFNVDCAPTGIAVATRTTGIDIPDELRLSLAGRPAVTAPSTGSYTIGRLAEGSYVLTVIAPANCAVSDGGQLSVNVTWRAVTPVTLDVTCGPLPRPEKIAFVSASGWGNATAPFLMLANPDGTGVTALQAGDSPSWSPDGTRFAFSTTMCFEYGEYSEYSCAGAIFLFDPEMRKESSVGGNKAYAPSWAPTGGALVFQGFGVRTGNQTLHVLQLSSRSLLPLDIKGPVSSEQPAWSPDGKRIAFVCRWSDNTDLCIVNADGSGLVRLTNDAPADRHPAWSRSGNSIAFARHPADRADPASGEIIVIDFDTRATTVLTKGTDPTWSPDGSRLAFAGDDGLFIIGADGTNLKRITTGNHRAPAWRP